MKGRSPVCFLFKEEEEGWVVVSQGRRKDGWRKGKEHGPNVPGQVFAPAKNHATITIAATLEGFCWRGTIAPTDTTILLLRLRLEIVRR